MIKDGLPTFVLVWCISANKRKQKYWYLCKNMHESMSRNWKNSSSMLQSPQKYLFSIEIEIAATVLRFPTGMLTILNNSLVKVC